MSSVVISGLRSPTNTWKWPGRVTYRQWYCCNDRRPIRMIKVKRLLLSWIFTWSVTGESSSATTHCLCLSSGLLVLWPSSPWPPVTREDSRRKQTQRKRVRPLPQSQITGSFFSLWLDVLHAHHFYSCDRELQLIRFVSVGHHYTCTSIAN